MATSPLPPLPWRQGFTAAIIGASGGIGAALAERLAATPECATVIRVARSASSLAPDLPPFDLCCEASIAAHAQHCRESIGELDLIIDATGVLQVPAATPEDEPTPPEKALRQLDPAAMARAFAINAIGPALLFKHFLPLLPRERPAAFASLSARVGSIGDNRLGGWVSYRASKAALNQIVRVAAIEAARRHKGAVVCALHPGTVATRLSAPFAGARDTLTPAQSAERLLATLAGLSPEQSGGFYAYDGSVIPW